MMKSVFIAFCILISSTVFCQRILDTTLYYPTLADSIETKNRKVVNFNTSHVDSVNFPGKLTITNSLFETSLKLIYDTFPRVNLTNNQFNSVIKIQYCSIGKNHLIVDSSHFSKSVLFESLNILSDSRFEHNYFDTNISFTNSCKFSNSYFQWDTFSRGANFTQTIFNGEAVFWQGHISGDVNFAYCSFAKKLILADLRISPNTQFNFNQCTFPDSIDFSLNQNIPNIINFGAAHRNPERRIKRIVINLYGTDISKIRLDYTYFQLDTSSMFIPRFNDPPIIINYDEQNEMYQDLLANFQTHHQTESYRLCDIEYKTFKGNHEGRWFYIWLQRWWWNWGYDPEYIFKNTGKIFLMFWFITWCFVRHFNENVYEIKKDFYSKKHLELRSFFDFAWRFWYSFIYTFSIFFGFTIRFADFKFKRVVECLFILVMYSLGIVCLAYMANFVLQKV